MEHTWGTEPRLAGFHHYTPRDLRRMLAQHQYRVVDRARRESGDPSDAIAALPEPLRSEASDHTRLQPREPDVSGMRSSPAGEAIETKHFVETLNPKTGAISQLRSKASGRDWASARQPLRLSLPDAFEGR